MPKSGNRYKQEMTLTVKRVRFHAQFLLSGIYDLVTSSKKLKNIRI